MEHFERRDKGISEKEVSMPDWEHQELEDKIRSLESKIDNLDYDLRQAKEDLESQIRQKASKDHSHPETE
jgi:predicted  nucleic acid-binding Zn-ribbon protein